MKKSLQEKERGWGGWSSWGKSLLSSATSTVGMSYFFICPFFFLSCLLFCMFQFSTSLQLCVFLGAGQSLTSVKVKAGEALRLHRTSVGEEAREEEDGAEETREGGGEGGEADPSSNGEFTSSPSGAPSSRGVFSTITHAVQNTVSENTQAHRTMWWKLTERNSLIFNTNVLCSRNSCYLRHDVDFPPCFKILTVVLC